MVDEKRDYIEKDISSGRNASNANNEENGMRAEADLNNGQEDEIRDLEKLDNKELALMVTGLKEKCTELEEQSIEYIDTCQRVKAEFDNYRKRMIKEQTNTIEMAAEGIVKKILPVIDNLERAVSAFEETRIDEKHVEGLRMIYRQLVEILEAEGLQSVDPAGKPFDPCECDAMSTEERDDCEEGTVTCVVQKGYNWKGKLIRPALVNVSRRPGAS